MSTYDPSKNYTWSPETKFVLEGRDFGLVLNVLRGILSTQEATNTILAYEANKVIENIIAASVAEGKIVEVEQQIPAQTEVENTPTDKKVRKPLKSVK
jgi:hypothetical protein